MKKYDFENDATRRAIEVLAEIAYGDEQADEALEYVCAVIEDLHNRATMFDSLYEDIGTIPLRDTRDYGIVVDEQDIDFLIDRYNHEPVPELNL